MWLGTLLQRLAVPALLILTKDSLAFSSKAQVELRDIQHSRALYPQLTATAFEQLDKGRHGESSFKKQEALRKRTLFYKQESLDNNSKDEEGRRKYEDDRRKRIEDSYKFQDDIAQMQTGIKRHKSFPPPKGSKHGLTEENLASPKKKLEKSGSLPSAPFRDDPGAYKGIGSLYRSKMAHSIHASDFGDSVGESTLDGIGYGGRADGKVEFYENIYGGKAEWQVHSNRDRDARRKNRKKNIRAAKTELLKGRASAG